MTKEELKKKLEQMAKDRTHKLMLKSYGEVCENRDALVPDEFTYGKLENILAAVMMNGMAYGIAWAQGLTKKLPESYDAFTDPDMTI